MEKTEVILLSGGKSTRFFPLKEKNLLPFFGIPLIEHQINRLKKAGFDNISLLVNSANHAFYNDLNCRLIIQQEEGLGKGILTALQNINSPVLLMNAGDLYNQDFLIQIYKEISSGNHESIFSGVEVKKYFPGGYLVLTEKKITGVIEKPGKDKMPSPYFKFLLDYFKNPLALKDELTKIKSGEDYEIALTNLIKQGLSVDLLIYKNRWASLKYPWHVLDIAEFLLDEIKESTISPTAMISPNVLIEGPVIIGDKVKIMENVKIIGPCYLGDNTIIGNNVLLRKSVIENDCVVGFSSDITRSYVGPDCWFHSNYIGDSVLEADISLGAGANIANLRLDDEEIYSNVKGINTPTGKNKLGAIIGKHTRIGVNASLMPGIKIGNGCFLASAVNIDQDIPERQFVSQKILTSYKNNIKLTNQDRSGFKNKI